MLRVWRVLLYGASAALAGAAVLQLIGRGVSFADAAGAAASATALQTCFLLQLLALIGLLVTASVRPTSVGRSALFWCGLLPVAEAGVLLVLLGLSVLAALLGAAGMAVFAAIVTRPTRQAAGAALG